MSKNPKNPWKSMKIANIDREEKVAISYWTTWAIPAKFSGKMWIVTYDNIKPGFHLILNLSLDDLFFEKSQGGQIDPSSRFRVKIKPKSIISTSISQLSEFI